MIILKTPVSVMGVAINWKFSAQNVGRLIHPVVGFVMDAAAT
jgi:hypothetical protein